ncbi:MAG: N-acetyltransferase family protein [Pseudomonadota bacterium]
MIRAATSVDAPWIMAMWNAVISDSLATFTTVGKSQAEVQAVIDTGTVMVLPDAAGFACYGPFRSGPGYAATVEVTIYLADSAQGTGQAAKLLKSLLDHAADAGKHIAVAAISGANPRAAAFFDRQGFDRVGHLPEVGQKAGRWLDLILMQKALNAQDNPDLGG